MFLTFYSKLKSVFIRIANVEQEFTYKMTTLNSRVASNSLSHSKIGFGTILTGSNFMN